MKTGIYKDKDFDWYKSIDALNRGLLHLFINESPKHYYYEKINGFKKESKSMNLGKLFEMYLLDQETFIRDIGVAPVIDKRKKEYKKFIKDNTQFKQIITQKELEQLQSMTKSIIENDVIMSTNAFKNMIPNVYMYAEIGDCKLKGQLDIYQENTTELYDLKTISKADYRTFQNHFFSYGYYIQAALYLDIYNFIHDTNIKRFGFICVESEAPYCSSLFYASESSLEIARQQINEAIREIKVCEDNNKWAGYYKKSLEINLPNWYYQGDKK